MAKFLSLEMKIVAAFIFLGISLHISGQDTYTVIKVSGKVTRQENGKTLASGDKLQINNALSFSSPDDYLIVISPKTGSQLINGVPENKPHEFVQLLQTFVKPPKKTSTYRGVHPTYTEELHSKLSSSTLVLGDGRIMVDTDKLSLKAPACIMSQYRTRKIQYRKISDNESFYLNKKALVGSDDASIESTITLYYCEDETEDPMFGNSTIIATILPVYVDEKLLLEEIKLILSTLAENNQTDEVAKREIKNYLEQAYAKVIDENLDAWIGQHQLLSQ